ncbi:MAG: NYN domain-containing protein [Candidatus Sericytochromatia bacterium]|nr:NYN domain-containing protein [Candidatus Sericytochromatia bacterium]
MEPAVPPSSGCSPRTALFIDAAYLDKLCTGPWAHGGAPLALDMRRLPALLNDGVRPWRVFYYHALPWRSDPPLPVEEAVFARRAAFVAFLARDPRWVLREGRLERRGGRRPGDWLYEQKRTDVQIAVDLVRLAWRGEIQRAVLLTGDSDLLPAVEDARAAGVHVSLRYAPGHVHADWLSACDAGEPLLETQVRQILRAPRSPA